MIRDDSRVGVGDALRAIIIGRLERIEKAYHEYLRWRAKIEDEEYREWLEKLKREWLEEEDETDAGQICC